MKMIETGATSKEPGSREKASEAFYWHAVLVCSKNSFLDFSGRVVGHMILTDMYERSWTSTSLVLLWLRF